jgi:Concanavalin A-like lectin/glucanases superfamily/PEP-CTERM motif
MIEGEEITPLIRKNIMNKRFSFVSALFLSVSFVSTADAGLVAFYSGNGNANDSVSGQNGTLENGAGFGPGLFGQSFLLNGTNQYISVPNSSTWAFGSTPFTIDLFANFNQINQGPVTTAPNVFVGHDDGGGNQNKWVFFDDGEGHLVFHINSPSLGPIFLEAPTTFFPVTNEWYNFAVTWTGTTYTFYANGVSLGSVSNSDTIPTASAPLTIGESEGLGYLNGRIENLGIYNVALSGSQIAALAGVPEPASVVMLGIGMLGIFALGRRRSLKKTSRTFTSESTDSP